MNTGRLAKALFWSLPGGWAASLPSCDDAVVLLSWKAQANVAMVEKFVPPLPLGSEAIHDMTVSFQRADLLGLPDKGPLSYMAMRQDPDPTSPPLGTLPPAGANSTTPPTLDAEALAKAFHKDKLPAIHEEIVVYWYVIPAAFLVVLLFECFHMRIARVEVHTKEPALLASRPEHAERGPGSSFWTFLSGIWPLAREYYFSGDMPRAAFGLAVALLGLTCFSLYLDLRFNKQNEYLWDAIQNKETKQFWWSMWLFCELALVKILTDVYRDYVMSMSTISWRAVLTERLQRQWLLEKAFYTQAFPCSSTPVDNPDQRLQEDAHTFVLSLTELTLSGLTSFGRLCMFLPKLYMLSPKMAFGAFRCPGWLLYISLIYSVSGCILTHLLGRRLVPLNYATQHYEANYRHAAVQVRDNAASIALYGSEVTENSRMTHLYDNVQRIYWLQIKCVKVLRFFIIFYEQVSFVFVFLILAPSYFNGSTTLGRFMAASSAQSSVKTSLDWFIFRFTDIASLRATHARLFGFSQALDESVSEISASTISKSTETKAESALSASGVRVCLPGGRSLWEDAALDVKPGERVLLMGPDGCGKSAFLKALAGCWPAEGSVAFGGQPLFLPQHAFVPEGSLHDAVAYPEERDAYSAEEVRTALRHVGLHKLAEGDLEEQSVWQHRLSGGERQRLAFAHALLRRPGVLLLDEATAAVGEEGAVELYKALEKHLPEKTAVISVDHDANAKVGPTHGTHLRYDPEHKGWVRSGSAQLRL